MLMIHLDPPAIRTTWQTHGTDAAAELRSARARTDAAGGHDLDGVSDCVLRAARDVRGALDVVLAVLDEHATGMEACVTDFETSDGNSAGSFDALAR